MTHSDIEEDPSLNSPMMRNNIDLSVHEKVKNKSGIFARGRIENHEGGGGIISLAGRIKEPPSWVIRTVRRQYLSHIIHDGYGNEYIKENNMITFKQYIAEIGDTPRGREAIARYVGTRMKQQAAAKDRANQMIHTGISNLFSNPKRASDLLTLGHGILSSKRSKNRRIGIERGISRIEQFPNPGPYAKMAQNISGLK